MARWVRRGGEVCKAETCTETVTLAIATATLATATVTLATTTVGLATAGRTSSAARPTHF